MDAAEEFMFSLPEKVQRKITYNLLRIEGGEVNSELFKKLENTEIWELRTLLTVYVIVCLPFGTKK